MTFCAADLLTPVEPRRSSLMFSGEENCSDIRIVSILHVENTSRVADAVCTAPDD